MWVTSFDQKVLNAAWDNARIFPINAANEGNASKSSHPDGYQISEIDSVRPSTGAIDIAKTLLRLLKWDELFDYMEIYPGSKVKHFESFHRLSGIPYNEMIFFDDEDRNIRDVSQLGVHSYLVDNGITVSLFQQALKRFERDTGLQ
ncbi:Magnesium-dependent phosphatase 1 [Clonorchis sinensis]|uniref:Magnesium-dependent phosphatase 1 n=1 Tax=Clonorchis sinensis TaxID=79923 RepID=A0A3R7JVK2_CLOSI|nr:Magnesium-dependent phosphatase 1 [Clonorchis sinensis]